MDKASCSVNKAILLQLSDKGLHALARKRLIYIIFTQQRGYHFILRGFVLQNVPQKSTCFIQGDYGIQVNIAFNGQGNRFSSDITQDKSIFSFIVFILSYS